MSEKTITQLYDNHKEKVTDKWKIYLLEYERLFSAYKNKDLFLFEIGVQNGGSLEIWKEYFLNAKLFVGCDVNKDCTQLSYEDSRIIVLVGDVDTDSIQRKVLDLAESYDLMIDDGSHLSSDIVKSFLRYFTYLADGGIYIVEDLHCSYWAEFEGGLFDPYSSISFFKRLADIINHESWGVVKSRTDLLAGFFSVYNVEIEEDVLKHIHSIEFINSMCVIRKECPMLNVIGSRIIAGNVDDVAIVDDVPNNFHAPDQSLNRWSTLDVSPEEKYFDLVGKIKEYESKIIQQKKMITVRDTTIFMYRNSLSWRLTTPLRYVSNIAQKILVKYKS